MIQRLQHTIDFTDESREKGGQVRFVRSTGHRPEVGRAAMRQTEPVPLFPPTPPVDPSELTFLAVDTRTPYTTDFDGADGGKQTHYMLRWVNTRGETGPWSETATATIGA